MNKSIALLFLLVALPASAADSAPLSDRDEEYVRQLILKGNTAMVHKQFPQAISDYEEVFKVDPGNSVATLNMAETYNNWGIMFYSRRQFAEAIEQWQHCLQINPKHAKARRNIDIAQRAAAQLGAHANLDQGHRKPGFDDESVVPVPGGELLDETKGESKTQPPSQVESTAQRKSQPAAKNAPDKSAEPAADSFSETVETQPASKEAAPAPVPLRNVGIYGRAPMANPPGNGHLPAAQPIGSAPGSASPLPPLNAVVPVVPISPAATPAPAVPISPAATTAPAAPISRRLPQHINATYPILRPQFTNQSQTPLVPGQILPTQYGMGTAPNAVLPPEPTSTASGAQYQPSLSAATPAAASLDDQLTAIEMKVYGHRQADMTVLQRLEKMEMDATKQAQSGTIVDRINLLRHNFGF